MVITYDLRPQATPKDYSHLAGGLTGLGATRLFLSSWAIRSSLTPDALAQAIWPYLDAAGDRLLVVEVGAHAEINTAPTLAAL
jgi:hypothetical protein